MSSSAISNDTKEKREAEMLGISERMIESDADAETAHRIENTSQREDSSEADELFPPDKFIGILFLICFAGLIGMIVLSVISNLLRG